MKTKRKTRPKLSKAQIATLSALAKKVDREERVAIQNKGRAAFARHEMMQRVIADLRASRQAQGLTLANVGEKSGIGKANVSRLENDTAPNPTWDTIVRYAQSVRRRLVVRID